MEEGELTPSSYREIIFMEVISMPLIRVTFDKESNTLTPYIKLSDNGWIEHNSFPATIEGYVAALHLAQNVMSGNFYPKRFVSASDRLSLDAKKMLSIVDNNDTKLIG